MHTTVITNASSARSPATAGGSALSRQSSFHAPSFQANPAASVGRDRDNPPSHVGPYRLRSLIARGGMGRVYHAVHRQTGEAVALKVIHSTTDRETERQRMFFMREMSVQSRLRHHRIVPIRDFGSDGNQWFIAMQFVPTFDLAKSLRNQNDATRTRLVCGLGCYVLEALDHLHGENIVHRDIKPNNVLVYRNRSNKVGLKLADFGISKDVRDAGHSGMTSDGEVRGTPAFMSPEQLRNSRDAGPSSDLYSAAAWLMYHLTECVPHQANVHEPPKLADMLTKRPIPMADRNVDVPASLCAVIDRGLLPHDRGRYQTAAEFHRALLPFTKKPLAAPES